MSSEEQQKVIKIPGGEFSLRKALRKYFSQESTIKKFQTFLNVLESLPLYLEENGREEEAEEVRKRIPRYYILLSEYEWAYRLIIPGLIRKLADRLVEIIIWAEGLIDPEILAEEIAVASESDEKPKPIPRGVLA